MGNSILKPYTKTKMTSFNDMTKEERDGLVTKLSEAIKKHGFEDKIKISVIR